MLSGLTDRCGHIWSYEAPKRDRNTVAHNQHATRGQGSSRGDRAHTQAQGKRTWAAAAGRTWVENGRRKLRGQEASRTTWPYMVKCPEHICSNSPPPCLKSHSIQAKSSQSINPTCTHGYRGHGRSLLLRHLVLGGVLGIKLLPVVRMLGVCLGIDVGRIEELEVLAWRHGEICTQPAFVEEMDTVARK